mmetsp:Transcript_22765/g.63216  ORF Transcript_22765/g.63216 Transcript_22765/m.63216 type:complete len:267 (-) Transcript_22765:1895-2695(-)
MADSMPTGSRVVLYNMNTAQHNNHVAVVQSPPSFLEPRVHVQVAGTEKQIKVRPECCRLAQTPRTEDDLQEGVSACFVSEILTSICPKTFIPEVLNTVFAPLRIQNVDMSEVKVTSVSSEAEAHPHSLYTYKASCTLEPGTDSCWISRTGHERPEWIVYCLGEVRRRVDFVSMSIPVMPHGPLSVRHFHLKASDNADGPWVADHRHQFVTLNEEGLQEFAVVPPIEARYLRLVCTENAAEGDSMFTHAAYATHGLDPIGFWEIAFA